MYGPNTRPYHKVGGIYILQYHQAPTHIKVGRSMSLVERISNYLTSTPFDVEILGLLPVKPYSKYKVEQLELSFLTTWSEYLTRGEWVKKTDAVVKDLVKTQDQLGQQSIVLNACGREHMRQLLVNVDQVKVDAFITDSDA